jgi:predicted secreted hydrolase
VTLNSLARPACRSLLGIVLLLTVSGAASAAAPSGGLSAPLVHFPADQAAHSSAKNEWWYVVGHLKSGSRTFGYELTIFKFQNVRPPGFASTISIFRTDVAITDEQGKVFYHQITPYFPSQASASTTTLDVQTGTGSIHADSLTSMSLKSSLPAGSVDVNLTSQRGPMYVGGRGYIPFGDSYTYYYSLTDLSTSGTLTLHGHKFTVSGISWLDHQWGDWSWSAIQGWTWMALQLGNGVQLSVFDFRSSSGRLKAASVLLANGHLRTSHDAVITSTGSWHSPHTNGTYPSGWIVHIPSLHAVLHVRPAVLDQELIFREDPRGSYWEGSGRVSGTWARKHVSGLSYVELTGYAAA